MDYVGLVNSPLWAELWQDKIVTLKVEAIRNQLFNTAVTEPHTLGELRGQLKGLQWLKATVEAMAEQQMKQAAGVVEKPDESASQVAWLRRRRI